MNIDKIYKLADEQKLDINKPICKKCLVNLTESTDDSGEGLLEMPKMSQTMDF